MRNVKDFLNKNKLLLIGIFIICLIIIIAFRIKGRETYTEYYDRMYSAKEVNYTIQYYKLMNDNNWEKDDLITKTGKVGDVIKAYNPEYPEGNWKTYSILNLPLTLSEDEEQNIIKVYYGEE